MSDKRPNWFAKHKLLTAVLIVIGLGVISGASGGNKSSNSTTNNSSIVASKPANTEPTKVSEPKKPSVPAEYISALAQATSYANDQHLSRQGVYDQLVSQYGGQFSAVAAQYTIDNVKADWNANALASAKSYQQDQHLSPAAIHDQLTSAYGEKFTKAEADYAIAHLND